jgi:predicted nuclease of predicted toxin-antitoxin system
MTVIKIYLDEDVHAFVAQALRLRGYKATTTAAEGRRGAEDTEQLDFATARGYALLTYD